MLVIGPKNLAAIALLPADSPYLFFLFHFISRSLAYFSP
jgi:hypothetical protein